MAYINSFIFGRRKADEVLKILANAARYRKIFNVQEQTGQGIQTLVKAGDPTWCELLPDLQPRSS
jgi:hypothetical protein